jgi:pimeloyl-ACP methyl ester carboxylesterase
VIINNKNIFIASDGAEVSYYVNGRSDGGAAVVFVHGLLDSAEDWNGVIGAASKSHMCVSFDLRGHGRSTAVDGFTVGRAAADLRELISHLSLGSVSLVGFSLGAFVVLEYVRTYGCDSVSKIVLADITPKFINEDGWNLGLYQGEYTRSEFERNMRGKTADFNREVGYFVYRNVLAAREGRRFRNTAPAWARLLTFLVVGSSPARKTVVYEYFKSMCECDERPALHMMTADTAVFYAEPGSLFPPAAAKYMADRISGATALVPFRDSAHITVLRPASRFARELLRFIGGGDA